MEGPKAPSAIAEWSEISDARFLAGLFAHFRHREAPTDLIKRHQFVELAQDSACVPLAGNTQRYQG